MRRSLDKIVRPGKLASSCIMTRVCIFGAGAIGSLLGAASIRGGAQVSLVARGFNLAAIRARGLTVRTHAGLDWHVRPQAASDDPADLGHQDFVLVAVKSGALPQVAEAITPLLSPKSAVAFFMNGIPWWYGDGMSEAIERRVRDTLDPSGALHRFVGVNRTIAGAAYAACTVVEPGIIEWANLSGRLVIGEPTRKISPRVEALADLLEAGGLSCETTQDIRAAIWQKLLINLASGLICLLTRKSMRASFSDPVLRDVGTVLVQEGLDVAAAVLGHHLPVGAEEVIAGIRAIDHKPSVLQDAELGRPTEFDVLFGLPQMFARSTGLATPTLDLMIALTRQALCATAPIERGSRERQSPAYLQPSRKRCLGDCIT